MDEKEPIFREIKDLLTELLAKRNQSDEVIESVTEQVSDNTKGIADVNDEIMILRTE